MTEDPNPYILEYKIYVFLITVLLLTFSWNLFTEEPTHLSYSGSHILNLAESFLMFPFTV